MKLVSVTELKEDDRVRFWQTGPVWEVTKVADTWITLTIGTRNKSIYRKEKMFWLEEKDESI